MEKNIPVLFLTYNRLGYTKQSLEALLKTEHPIEILIWDNGSTDGTVEWLHKFSENWKEFKHPITFVYNDKNVGLNKPTNYFLKLYKNSEFIAKVDNDTIVQSDWIGNLLHVMKEKPELDALGAYMQRPPGPSGSFEEWSNSSFMRKINYYVTDKSLPLMKDHLGEYPQRKCNQIAYCAYCGGTGVLIRMRMFKEMGLLWEGYKSLQGDLTCMFRLRSDNGKKDNVAWYSGTTVKLLNIKVDGKELSDDYPEYDKELNAYRDAGNKWYVENGGPIGIQKLIDETGGRAKL